MEWIVIILIVGGIYYGMYRLALSKNRNPWNWILPSILISPVILIIILACCSSLPKKKKKIKKKSDLKNYLIIIVVSLCFITTSKADDIEDFQIGKMNVRDSLLDYFDRKLIITDLNSKYTFFYKNNTYAIVTAGNSNNYDLKIDTELYDDIAITIKPDDKNFIIYALSGRIFCSNDINYCKSKKKEIENDLKDLFGKNVELKKNDGPHSYDKTGRTKTYNTYFKFKSGDYISVSTYDWEMKNKDGVPFPDNTKVSIMTNEFEKFLSKVQFN